MGCHATSAGLKGSDLSGGIAGPCWQRSLALDLKTDEIAELFERRSVAAPAAP